MTARCRKCGTPWTGHLPGGVQRRRKKLLQRHRRKQDNLCCWCHEPMGDDMRAPNFATLEHLVKVSAGGADTEENTKAACQRCNSGRHTVDRSALITAAWESLADMEPVR